MTNWKQRLLQTLADLLGVDYQVEVPAAPIDYITTLPDDPHTIYVWGLQADTTQADLQVVAEQLGRVQRQHNLQAVHILTRDVKDIRHLSPQDVRQYLLPILETQEGSA